MLSYVLLSYTPEDSWHQQNFVSRAQLLAGIDQLEIQSYNDEAVDGLNDAPQGREHI